LLFPFGDTNISCEKMVVDCPYQENITVATPNSTYRRMAADGAGEVARLNDRSFLELNDNCVYEQAPNHPEPDEHGRPVGFFQVIHFSVEK
jgi:hypothetical protein